MTIREAEGCEARRKLLAAVRLMPANAASADYLERARRIRALAEEARLPYIKVELLSVAVEFEAIAQTRSGEAVAMRVHFSATH
jgi:hypothetical protein